MAKKITIQHLYTTTGTTAPTGDLTLGLGEISISHLDDNEAIFIMQGGGKDGKPVRENKFIPQYQIEKLINTKLGEAGVESPGVITALTSDLKTHKNTEGSTGARGHVELKQGDLSEITAYTAGHAAASYHEHSQYLEPEQQLGYGFSSVPGLNNGHRTYSVKNGTGITVNENGVSISEEYQNMISSGVTAFNWGNHAEKGYAKNSDLTAHTGSADIHVTTGDKNNWNTAANAVTNSAETWNETTTKVNTSASTWNTAAERINTFMDSEQIDGAVDTLKEIQQFLDGTGSTVQTLLDNLSALTDTVSDNTTAINQNSEKIGTGFTSSNTIREEIEKLKAKDFRIVGESGDSLNINYQTNISNVGNQYVITHLSATTQASAITAANNTTDLSFGSEFKIVDNIGYDKNGHVVSGSTQTLKLPILGHAQESVSFEQQGKAGIVRIAGCDTEYDVDGISDIPKGAPLAVGINHYHSSYVKFTDLSSNTGGTITISCGTY